MTRADIWAIDPGPTESAWVMFDGTRPYDFDKEPNDELLMRLHDIADPKVVVIEQVRSYGMPVGAEVFDTVHWSGRFHEAAAQRGWEVWLLPRKDVKLHVCGSPRANDATIRQALIDRFGGKDKAIGKKANPGPLHGAKADVWQAAALGLTWADKHVPFYAEVRVEPRETGTALPTRSVR